jgi:histidine triad (HIT) family protein
VIGLAAALALAVQQPPATGLDGPYDSNGVFARILRGTIPVAKVCEDQRTLVFIPKDWRSPGEILVIPKRHVRNLLGLQPRELERLMVAVQHAAVAQRRALHSTGFQVVQNNGATSEQTVFHVHFHVVPSFGRVPTSADFRPDVPMAEMQAMGARLKRAWPTRGRC